MRFCAAIGLGCIVGTFIEPSASIWPGRQPSSVLVLGMRHLRVGGILNMGGADENGEPNGEPTPTDIRPHQATISHGFPS